MKKHFLLLMMAFFSLAGYAELIPATEPVDLSDGWTIQLSRTTATYTGGDLKPTVTLVKEGYVDLDATKFTVTWSPAEVKDVRGEGYTVTVTNDMTHTFKALATPTATFFIMKSTADFVEEKAPALIVNEHTVISEGLSTTPIAYNGSAQAFISNANAVAATIPNIATGVAAPTVMYKVNDGEWSTTPPSATNPGTYVVKCKIVGTDNYNGKDEYTVGTVVIEGTEIEATDFTAPAGVADLTFRWNNSTSAAIAQDLITEGEVDAAIGTMYYASKFGTGEYSEWSTSIPTGSAAGTYTVKYKIVGAGGHADYAETALADITIAKVTPVVTAATGATNLQYTGEDQNLLTATGSATFGATEALRYKVYYSAAQLTDAQIGEITWNTIAAKEYANVKDKKAGYYYISTLVPDGGNYIGAAAAQPVQVTIAKPSLFTVAPAAADLTWNNADQQLITATVKEDGIAKYYFSEAAKTAEQLAALEDGEWKDITAIKASAAKTYYAYYKVVSDNYQAVAPTQIPNVKIKKKVLSVKVNDITKVYDGNVNVDAPAAGKFTFVTRIENTLDFSGVAYSEIAETNKNAGTHEGVVTVTAAALEGVSTNYEYTIIPGDLIINKAKVTVTANGGLQTVYGTPKDISNEYVLTGKVAGEADALVFSTMPILTSNAPATNPAVGDYTLSFTKGTLKADGNYEMSTEGDGGYIIPEGAKFSVIDDPDRKLVITVLPHTQQYTGVAESWDNMVVGKDYAVNGLIDGDAIVVAPTFSRSDATNFNVGTYDLTATINENTIVADKTKYPGGIIVNNSTFTIAPRVLTATIPQQTVLVGASALADPNGWTVEGLQNNEAQSILNGTLTLNTATGVAGNKDNGIKLTIENENYTFTEGAANQFAYGNLLIISADQFVLNPANTNLNNAIQAAGTGDYTITFGSMAMNAGEWYAYVFPFEVSLVDLVKKLDTYVVVNKLKSSTMDEAGEVTVKFAVEMEKIPAGVPFLIKPAAAKNWNVEGATFTGKIAKTITDVETEKATLTGTYEGGTVKWGYGLDGTTADADAKYRWLAHKEYKGDNNWKNPKSNAHTLAPMEAYLVLDPAAVKARVLVEDIDENGTTAIKSLSVENVNGLNVKGWYTVGGMKLQGAPTQKGVYIKDGKKVIIK